MVQTVIEQGNASRIDWARYVPFCDYQNVVGMCAETLGEFSDMLSQEPEILEGIKADELDVDIGADAVDDNVFATLRNQFLPVLHISNRSITSVPVTKTTKVGTKQYEIAIRLRARGVAFYYCWRA